MVIALTIALSCVSLLLIAAIVLLVRNRFEVIRLTAELKRFDDLSDLEKHKEDQRALAVSAKAELADAQASLATTLDAHTSQEAEIERQRLRLAELDEEIRASCEKHECFASLDELRKQIADQELKVKQYQKVVANFKSAAELKSYIETLRLKITEQKQTIGNYDTLARLQNAVNTRQREFDALEARIEDLQGVLGGVNTVSDLQAKIIYQENLLAELKSQAEQVEETLAMQEFGFYRPRYDFDSASEYQRRLDQVRAQQKDAIKREQAVQWQKTWTVEDSEEKGRKMMKEQSKLILRAFNGECDAAIAKVKYDNATNMEKRIQRSCDAINRLGKTNTAGVADTYMQLKLQELYLVHEHRVKKQEEREEQLRIKEQMREEEKVRKEIEKVQKDAERDERNKESALEQARRALEEATRNQSQATAETQEQNRRLAEQVAKLENELKEAIDRKAKAIARAQLTKSGHVYILSNVGSFGESVYKIGMTRRFEPLERVYELGGASVPFRFDVHAMIYSENAPSLENKLHKHFAHRRVNRVNLRREYFRVTLDEIREAVAKNFGEVTFVTLPEAAEYRETQAMLREERQKELVGVDRGGLATASRAG